MHEFSPSNTARSRGFLAVHRSTSAFSLVEITLALGIIAFAFVAILGLLPVGLNSFRNAIDTGNEARIAQSFSTQLLATDYEVLEELDFEHSGEIYYFDEEAIATDTEKKPVLGRQDQRLYGVKLFVDNPNDVAEDSKDRLDTKFEFGRNVLVVFANLASPAKAELESIGNFIELREHFRQNHGRTQLRTKPLFIAKMDGLEKASSR